MEFRFDERAASPAYYYNPSAARTSIVVHSSNYLQNFLLGESLEFKSPISRFCFHDYSSTKTQFMFIQCQSEFFFANAINKHFAKYFVVVKGSLEVCELDSAGVELQRHCICASNSDICVIPSGTPHVVHILPEGASYFEIIEGPVHV